jgi:hypothetical protein
LAPLHVANASVHPMPLPQHASPTLPHAPAWQPPLVHVPPAPEHAVPFATHLLVVPSQHPPALHVLSSQHGCPVPPHVWQVGALPPPLGAQTRPDAVQNGPARPLPFGLPGQHACPDPPHALPPMPQDPPVQVCPVPPHAAVVAMHVPPTQHEPTVVHASPAQHGPPFAPHAVGVPFKQMLPVVVVSPDARQTLLWQQPPPAHALFAQHAWPGPPQTGH